MVLAEDVVDVEWNGGRLKAKDEILVQVTGAWMDFPEALQDLQEHGFCQEHVQFRFGGATFSIHYNCNCSSC